MQFPLKQYRDLLADYLKPQSGRVLRLVVTLLGSIGLQILNRQLLGYFIDAATTDRSTPPLHPMILISLSLGYKLNYKNPDVSLLSKHRHLQGVTQRILVLSSFLLLILSALVIQIMTMHKPRQTG